MKKIFGILGTATLAGHLGVSIYFSTSIEQQIDSMRGEIGHILTVTSSNIQNTPLERNVGVGEGQYVRCTQETSSSIDNGLDIETPLPIINKEIVFFGGREALLYHIMLENGEQLTIVNTDLPSFKKDYFGTKRIHDFKLLLKQLSSLTKVIICIDRNTLFPGQHTELATKHGFSFTQDWNTGILENSEHFILRILGGIFYGKNGFPLDAIYVRGFTIDSEGTGQNTGYDHISVKASIVY